MIGMGLIGVLSLGWLLFICFGSALALRGSKSWATWSMMIGSSLSVIGAVLAVASYFLVWTTYRTSSPGPVPVPAWLGLIGAGGILIGGFAFSIGLVVF